jgi:hypothetical protein
LRRKAREAVAAVDVANRASLNDAYERITACLSMENSEDRLPVLLDLTAKAPSPLFWLVFEHEWPTCDATWSFRDLLLTRLRRYAPNPLFKSPPDQTLTVWRGCDRDRVLGLSWTTDRKIAQGFARGHRGIRYPNPVVAYAEVTPSAVFFYDG